MPHAHMVPNQAGEAWDWHWRNLRLAFFHFGERTKWHWCLDLHYRRSINRHGKLVRWCRDCQCPWRFNWLMTSLEMSKEFWGPDNLLGTLQTFNWVLKWVQQRSIVEYATRHSFVGTSIWSQCSTGFGRSCCAERRYLMLTNRQCAGISIPNQGWWFSLGKWQFW